MTPKTYSTDRKLHEVHAHKATESVKIGIIKYIKLNIWLFCTIKNTETNTMVFLQCMTTSSQLGMTRLLLVTCDRLINQFI